MLLFSYVKNISFKGGIGTIRKAMLDSLTTRFHYIRQDKNMMMAMFLDPRFKTTHLAPDEVVTVEAWLADEKTVQVCEIN